MCQRFDHPAPLFWCFPPRWMNRPTRKAVTEGISKDKPRKNGNRLLARRQ
jgi:hypothetical protein